MLFIYPHSQFRYQVGRTKERRLLNMNKLFTKVAATVLGLSLAAGVGVAVSSNKASNVRAASPATLTFTAACGGSGTDSDGNTWTVSSDGTESSFDSTKGIHYGTSSGQVTYIRLSTSGITGTITQVVVNASTASGVTATVGVTVAGSQFGDAPKSLTTSASNYTFSGSASGTIQVEVTKPSKAAKAIYCKSISVTYSSGSGPSVVNITRAISGPSNLSKYTSDASFDIASQISIEDESPASGYSVGTSDASVVSVSGTSLTPEGEGIATITISKDSSSTTDDGVTTNITYTPHTFTVTVTTPEGDDEIDYTKRYSSDTSLKDVTLSKTNFSITFGGSGTAAKYYTNGTAVRAYPNNTITVVALNSRVITSITFTFGSSDSNNTITSSPSGFTSPTWSGSSGQVVFTIGGSSNNRRITKIAVTTAAQAAEITGFSIDPTTADLGINKSLTISATVTGTGAFDDDVTWDITSGSSFVSITSSSKTQCVVHGDAVGTAVITATNADDDSLTCTITVKQLSEVTATINFANTNDITSQGTSSTTWSNKNVTFVVTKGESSTDVGGASQGFLSNPLRVYANQVVTISAGGDTITSIEITANSSTYATNMANATWTGATASASGLIVSVTPSSTTISFSHASLQMRFDSITIVYEGAAPSTVDLNSITLNKAATTIAKGDHETLSVSEFDPSNATNKNVVWSSEDDTIASVDQTGKVTVSASATVGATVKIYATPEDTNASAVYCTVTVGAATISSVNMRNGLTNTEENRLVVNAGQGLSMWPNDAIKVTYTDGTITYPTWNDNNIVWYYINSDSGSNDIEINNVSTFAFASGMKRMRLSYSGVMASARTYITVDTTASEFAQLFMTMMTCDGGETAPSTSDWEDFGEMWDDVNNATISEVGKAYLKSATAASKDTELPVSPTDAEYIACALARYDYIVGKYNIHLGMSTEYPDFMDRSPAEVGGARVILGSVIGENTNTVAIIIVISMVSVTAIGGYFFIRKRKVN